jgi:FIST-like protein
MELNQKPKDTEKFAIAYSQRRTEELAVKEISLMIKKVLPRQVDLAIVFFTGHYRANFIKDTISLVLKPKQLIGVQAPLLIYEDKTIDRGVVVACMDLVGGKVSTTIVPQNDPGKIEVALMKTRREAKFYNLLWGFVPPNVHFDNCMRGFKFGLGRSARILCSGYEYEPRQPYQQIINQKTGQGFVYLTLGSDVNVHYEKFSGFLPIGNHFTFTKVDRERNVILEINDRPAVDIYRQYLEDKYDLFIKKQMFYLYPFGVMSGNAYRLLNIKGIVEPGALLYTGYVDAGQEGKLMLINEDLLGDTLRKKMTEVREKIDPKLMIIVSSLARKNILKNKAENEIRTVKEIAGQGSKMIGFYSDYQIVFDDTSKEFIIEKGDLYVTFWGNR